MSVSLNLPTLRGVCSNQQRMQIEKDYLAALAKVREFRFEGEMLSLSGDGVTLRLSPKK